MPSITEDLRRLDAYKAANPDLSKVSDAELSRLINEQTGELSALTKSSFVGRSVGKVSNFLSDAGQSVEQTIVGDKQQASRPRRVVGRAANMVVQSAPEIAANYAAARVLPQSKTAAGLILAGNVGAAAARTEVETGDTKAAVASGAGALASSIGSIAGAKVGRRLATKGGLGAAGQAASGAAGGYVGSMPGDALEISAQPGGFSEFLSDPDNLPAYLLSQAPFAAVDYMSERGNAAKMNREKSVAEIPTLDEFSQPQAEQQLVQLKKKPVATLTEQDLARMEQLTAELQDKDRKRIRGQEVAEAQNIKQEYSGISYESPATLRSQLLMVNKGKKPVAFVEKGSTMPKMEVWEQQYVEHQRPEGTYFYNPDIVTPQAIDDAVKSDTLGQLLGYGVPSKPKNPNGLSYTLRDRKGNEKLSVELSYDTMTTVGAALKKLKEPTDRLVIEGTERVLAERKRAQQLIRDYSVRYEPDPYAGANPDWQYIGQQPGFKHIPATELWNYVGQAEHPEFVRGSTYSRNSLEKAGVKLPPLATRSVGVDEATTTDKSRADYSINVNPVEKKLSDLIGRDKLYQNYIKWAKDGIPDIRIEKELSTLPGAVSIKVDQRGKQATLFGSMLSDDTFSISGLGDAENAGLGAAIKHAQENGATKIVVPKEMRSAAKRFTQSFGKDLPEGRVEFPITDTGKELDVLFSIYGQTEQFDYASSLVKAENELDAALLSGQDLTNEQFVNAIFQGKNVDKAVALNYLKNATGSLDTIKSYVMNGGPVDIAGVTTGKDIAVNVAKDPIKAFRTAAHELSHVATNELKYSNPAAYNDLLSFFNDLTTIESRTRMFDQLAQASGLAEFDSKYQAGAMFDKNDPNYRERVMKEGVAALSEVLAHEAYKSDARISPAVAKWLSFMPVGVQSFLSRLMNKLATFFGPQYPSLRHMLSSEDRALLSKGFDKVVEFTRANQAAQDQAYKLLRRNGLIDEDTLLNRVQNRDDQSDWKAARQTLGASGDEEVRDFALNFLTESRLANKARDTYEEYFFSPLFRAKIKPFTMDAFRELHHFRDKVKSFLNGYTEFLGQDKDKTRSREQAIAEQQKWIDRTVNNKSLNDKFNKVLSANLERREKAMAEGRTATVADLVSPEMMQSQYGLTQEESEYLSRLIETPKLVAEQTLRFMTATDTVNLAKMFFIQNRTQDIKEVKAKSAELTRVAGEAGAAAFQKRFYEEALQRMAADPSGNAQQIAEVQNRLMEIKVKTMQASQVFDAMTRQLFGQNFEMPGAPGEDFFINSMRDLAFKQAEVRAEQQFITKDEGYFPLVRRGRYLLRVFNEGPEDSIIKTTKEYKGFKTEKELREYVKKKKYRQEQIEVTDKEEIRNRVSLYSPKQVQALRDKTRADLQKTIDRLINSREFANEQIKTAVVTNLQDVINSYRPLEQELKDVVSVKGDKFRERRWLVPGYEENDFIPNLYEYMSYKTVSGQKTLTRAEVELQHLRQEIQNDPQLLQRMQQETDYVLSRTSEWKNVRKFIFYSYLGASIKNALQNFLQLPLNAVPEAFAKGAGLHAYSDMIKAGGMSAKWLKDGTTGNKTFDVLLKQAETDGNVIPNLVEAYAPGADDVQNALDSVNKESNGYSWIGQKVDQAKSATLSGLDRFMRSTSVASEAVNRRVSFLMSLQDSTRKGIKDPVQMYNNARDFTDFANFVGDKANRPGFQTIGIGKSWVHGPLLAATAMQSFVFNHISQLYAYRKQAKAGDANAKKAFNAAMLHLVVFAGVLGIPLASTIEQLTEEYTGFSAKNTARKKIIETATGLFDLSEEAGGRWADAITTGLPTALGIDAGGSIGLGDPLLQYRAGEEITGVDLLGPGGSLANRWGQTLSSAIKGDWNTANRQVPLKVWNHLTKIYDAVSSGDYKSQKGMPIVQSLGTGASVATVLGFTPRQVSIQRDMQNLRRKNDLKDSQKYQETVTQIARKLMDFQQSGDPLVQQEATELFDDYNKSTGYSQDRNDMIQSIVETMGRFRQPTTQPASAKSQQAYDAAASVFPEAKPHYAQQLPLLYEELATAQTLGQDDVLAKRMSSAQQSARRRALYDSLIQAGYSPAQASALSSGNTENLMRSLPSSTGQPAPAPQVTP